MGQISNYPDRLMYISHQSFGEPLAWLRRGNQLFSGATSAHSLIAKPLGDGSAGEEAARGITGPKNDVNIPHDGAGCRVNINERAGIISSHLSTGHTA